MTATLTPETKGMLDAPLDTGRVSTRDAGRGRMVPYLEGWDVIACANAIFGYNGWSYEVLTAEALRSWDLERTNRQSGEVYPVLVTLYQARVRVEALGAVRIDVGTSVTSEDTAEAHDTAIKGAATDGLKRALRTFGAQFGNDLYDKNGPPPQAADSNAATPVCQPARTVEEAIVRANPPAPQRPQEARRADSPTAVEQPIGPAWGPVLRNALAERGIRGLARLADYLYSTGETSSNVVDSIQRWLDADLSRDVIQLAELVAAEREGQAAK